MAAPPMATTTTALSISNYLNDQQGFMRIGQNFTIGDTGIPIEGNVKIGGLINGDLGDSNNTNAAAETHVYTLMILHITIL